MLNAGILFLPGSPGSWEVVLVAQGWEARPRMLKHRAGLTPVGQKQIVRYHRPCRMVHLEEWDEDKVLPYMEVPTTVVAVEVSTEGIETVRRGIMAGHQHRTLAMAGQLEDEAAGAKVEGDGVDPAAEVPIEDMLRDHATDVKFEAWQHENGVYVAVYWPHSRLLI
mmetsp:Transcript_64339/g.96987  ORF Transcript_64339/g.96987 Transcript_64339/m.96987 type:complete len:166 (-) Transcript_64339:260-757(-)